eukprot:CAMPEP_0197688468 /NCGR_PEP_ID=MMETSP1338-20131121/105489_1 /TAXON_ID=43686 ORGANISM="Pelagodinium beii, Strain RCC1491" /NCGR_SAMPLE_ID=MMETSP1338 /ASSEMBLY_ACC=CAM_ASM_000754 /LENGTH=479 /DNA_ID=CAMNT_0043270683 /DNA_START=27 /DNA_END=1463 /DNA_ORIENTATION=-
MPGPRTPKKAPPNINADLQVDDADAADEFLEETEAEKDDYSHVPKRVPTPSTAGLKPPTPSSGGLNVATDSSKRDAQSIRKMSGDLAAAAKAANKQPRVSVSKPDVLSRFCSMLPALSLFGHYGTVVLSTLFFPSAAYVLSCFLTILVFFWVTNMAISSALGVLNMRRETQENWHAKVQSLPAEEVAKVHHIVILPNYMEHEPMLKETLDNLGKSPMANVMQVVLAMECRERGAMEKAGRIIEEKKHLFADVCATFHPAGLPNETAGKSSNSQWAFSETSARCAGRDWDTSLVFVSVADADSMFHPHYFSALAYQGLTMSKDERSWSIWQPPVLLFRNFFAVPSMTRVSSLATLIFELASLSNQKLFTAFAYSSYSITLALGNHPAVDGWDADVIAEDHHMFCKCWFGALWNAADNEQIGSGSLAEIKPKLKLQPIFLPCLGYLVESSEGYMASLHARFKQARRHMQGIVELGYVVLQW